MNKNTGGKSIFENLFYDISFIFYYEKTKKKSVLFLFFFVSLLRVQICF